MLILRNRLKKNQHFGMNGYYHKQFFSQHHLEIAEFYTERLTLPESHDMARTLELSHYYYEPNTSFHVCSWIQQLPSVCISICETFCRMRTIFLPVFEPHPQLICLEEHSSTILSHEPST